MYHFITNNIGSFHKTTTVAIGFHKMIVTVCKTSFQKFKPKEILHKNNKSFDINISKSVLRLKIQFIKSCKSFEQVFFEVLNEHAPLKEKVSSSKSCTIHDKVITQNHHKVVLA